MSARYVLGESVEESFDLGSPLQTFSRFASFIDDDAVTWNPTFDDTGSGFYRYNVLPSVAGSYSWVGSASGGTHVVINFEVGTGEPDAEFRVVREALPYLGAIALTFTPNVSFIDDVPIAWEPTFTEIGGGFYRYSYLPTRNGSYSWTGQSSNGDYIVINFDVNVAIDESGPAPYPEGEFTLREARRLIASRAGSYLELEATAATTGLTFQDRFNLRDDALLYRGAEILFYTGPNAGEKRRIIGLDGSSGTLTLSAPDLPGGGVAEGDIAGLFNIKTAPLRIQEIDREINSAIRESHPHTGARATFVTDVFSQTNPFIILPSSFTHVEDVAYTDAGGFTTNIPRATWENGPGWSAIYGMGTVLISGGWEFSANGYPLTILGRQRHATVHDDADIIYVDQEWLVEYVTGLLLMGRKDEFAGQGAGRINRVDQLRAKIAWVPGPDAVQVR